VNAQVLLAQDCTPLLFHGSATISAERPMLSSGRRPKLLHGLTAPSRACVRLGLGVSESLAVLPRVGAASGRLGFRRAQLGGSGGKPAQGSRTFTAPITLQAASMDGTNALILPCKRKKTVQGKAKNGKKNRQDPKISKTKLKKLQKLEEEKQKRVLQARSFEILRNHKISIDEYSLLHASATIGQV